MSRDFLPHQGRPFQTLGRPNCMFATPVAKQRTSTANGGPSG